MRSSTLKPVTGLGAVAGGIAVGALAGIVAGLAGAIFGALAGALAGGLAGRWIAGRATTRHRNPSLSDLLQIATQKDGKRNAK